ncbi:MAG TPA: cation:proton antiporter [Methylomirabilota bacterium]|jgi:Kef-type K+ transport system membrane component KefB|nr:cation:proton antiporter [Methylomirabilota bacterium]
MNPGAFATRHRWRPGPRVAPFLPLTIPVAAWAATPDHPARTGSVLFGLALLIVGAKVGGLIAERWSQPSVLGELLVGIAAGNLLPLAFGERGIAFVRGDPTLHVLAELGVLLLLFDVGLEADLRALVRVGPSAGLVAAIGVIAPFALGWGIARWLLPEGPALAHVFVGATLTATSVGITARVLKDLGGLQSREGQVILAAAVLDDILGLVVLAVITGLVTAASSGGPGLSAFAVAAIVLKAVLFLGITVGLAPRVSGPIVRLAGRTGHHGTLLVLGVALCFTLAFAAERIGLAGIVGAFAAGLLLDPYGEGVRTRDESTTLSELLHPLSSVFVPLFFVLMGIQVDVGTLLTPASLGFGLGLVIVGVLGKLASAAGVVGRGINRLAVAVGMVPRGEVGLIFAGIGATLTLEDRPLLSDAAFSALVLMVVVTTLLAPIGLRWTLRPGSPGRGTGRAHPAAG